MHRHFFGLVTAWVAVWISGTCAYAQQSKAINSLAPIKLKPPTSAPAPLEKIQPTSLSPVAPAATQAQPLAPMVSQLPDAGGEPAPLDFALAGGPTASTLGGVGPLVWFDGYFENAYQSGFYEGGFFPHILVAAEAFPGFSPTFMFSIGGKFLTNRETPNRFNLRDAWVHGYREIFRANSIFWEGNFLGLIPYFVTGYKFRLPFGYVEVQWLPFEFLRATKDLMFMFASGAQGVFLGTFAQRHFVVARAKAAGSYLGGDGLYLSQVGPGFVYLLEGEYHFKLTKKLRVGIVAGWEGALATARDSRTLVSAPYSTLGLRANVFVMRNF